MKLFKNKGIVTFLIAMPVMMLAFQNCGKGFSSLSSVDDSSEQGGLNNNPPPNGNPPPSNHSAHILTSALKIESNANLEFLLNDADSLQNMTYMWSHALDGAQGACQVVLSSTSKNYIINCNKTGSLRVSLAAQSNGKPITLQDYVVSVVAAGAPPPPPPGPANPLVVNFSIAAGTGTGPWNTLATRVEVYVGQTLVIKNDDTIVHQLHTGGNPCPHGTPIQVGASFNCVISTAYSGTNGLYDHIAGVNALFHLVAYDGAQLYAQNCAGCHAPLATSTKKGRTALQVGNAMKTINPHPGIPTLFNLTPKQVEAIAHALK